MIFNSFLFVFAFLPLVLTLFYFPGLERQRPYVLLGASLIFYGYSGLTHLVVLLIDVVWVYYLTKLMVRRPSIWLLATIIILPVLFLLYFKYLGFIIHDILGIDRIDRTDDSFSLFENILLPAGISFFTFQAVSYAVDHYRTRAAEAKSFRDFALYISFFPQLVAGPIVRFEQISKSLTSLVSFRLTQHDARIAVGLITLGFAYKVLIADALSRYIAPAIAAPEGASPIVAIYLILAYSFRIYFDFYGYSLIAIGLGYLFGFRLPRNFKRPYLALNPKDFWQRWHITLSSWIRDYIYIPLGGNASYVKNIFIVFAITGLWHGAGWNFIVWGLIHGVLVVIYHLFSKPWNSLPKSVQFGLNFTLVSLAWLLFVYDLDEINRFVIAAVGYGTGTLPLPSFDMWFVLGLAAVICFGPDLEDKIRNWSSNTEPSVKAGIAFGIVAIAIILFTDMSDTFIYFRF